MDCHGLKGLAMTDLIFKKTMNPSLRGAKRPGNPFTISSSPTTSSEKIPQTL
jgi:hypothetical protein